ncbi:genetic competence negative regulator [Salimicrobium sp. PL1-032A]|uniref:genetic competence negative regulator n=1 Tax=Salimicrobium sp. PL1-032A TaxID=3095364 RepID=UPI0032601956
MRIERLTAHKFKIFLTSDDLTDRGLEKEGIWKDLPRVHQIFSDMITDAQDELGEEFAGELTVQLYLLQAQGMLVIVTKSGETSSEEDFLEMKVTLDEHRELMYRFEEIEDVISVTKVLYRLGMTGGTLYAYDESYYLVFEDYELDNSKKEDVIALLSEYAGASTMSSVWLQEYGTRVAFRETVERFRSFS